jgi:hypothetical protein
MRSDFGFEFSVNPRSFHSSSLFRATFKTTAGVSRPCRRFSQFDYWAVFVKVKRK